MASFPNRRRFRLQRNEQRPLASATKMGEAARLALAGVWVLSLTLFCFYQYLYLAQSAYQYESTDALLAAAVILRGLPHYWWMSFLPSLAFGIAWLGVSRLSWRPGLGLLKREERNLRVRAISTFSVALLGWILIYKIWVVVPFIGADFGLASPELLAGYLESHVMENSALVREMFFKIHGVNALLLLVVFLESRQQARSVSHSLARTTGAFTVGFLAIATLIPAANLYSWLRPPSALHVLKLRGWPKGLRTAIEGGERGEADWRFYALSRGSDAEWVTPRMLRWLVASDSPEACAVARLPFSPLFTWAIPLALTQEPPVDTTPRLALEIPASGQLVRMYGPSGEQQEIPIDALGAAHVDADWVIFKADTLLAIRTIRKHLETLRELGVRRISAVVRPVGWGSPSGVPVRLSWGRDTTALLFEPERVPGRSVVYVSRWIPPPGADLPLPQCDPFDARHDRRSQWRLILPGQGTVPAKVSVSGVGIWQDLLTRLSMASAGGAESIRVILDDE